MRHLFVLLIFILLSFGLRLNAQTAEKEDSIKSNWLAKGAGFADDLLGVVTMENGRHAFSIYPAMGYSPRTGLEFGIMPVWRMQAKRAEVKGPTTLSTSFLLSLGGMYNAKIDLRAFVAKNWLLWSKAQYTFLPDKFYGLGNAPKQEPYSHYDLNVLTLSMDLAKGIGEKWFFGVRMDINRNMHENRTGDLLNESVTGYKGGWANGVGPMMVFDSRNDVLYPSKGSLLLISHLFYGGDFKFTSSSIDYRKYFSIVKDKSILAWQGAMTFTNGSVPFYKLSTIGGKELLRGIPHPHKYLDKNAWYSQLEWRQHFWWRIGATAFTGVGKVMPDFKSNFFSQLHAVAGLGFRFKVLPDEGLNFRLDYGVSNHNERSLFFTIREAF
ncbi:BamA/TamA family outer membrane protein [Carboxylicivirga sp. N1Y90]|uniref:BamA/TamA family outer membrane protein n=1 Tax=Carboxylicivirga fragile TaxID=3417571 RepID=UPI003D3440B2|nr:BamA/TamA family outer membrane protein [Marinilabiliaceae bacterium N1Y90]